jgi:LruC domain-containing protein
MRHSKYITLLFLFAIFVSACRKDAPSVEETEIESVNDLIVPADFDWKTTKTIDVLVDLPESGDLQPLIITNRDGSKRYFRGYPENGSRTIRTKITIPTFVKELKLTYSGAKGPNMVFVDDQNLNFDFNNTFKSATATSCNLSGFTTYSKGGWGQKAHGNNVGKLRDTYFDQVYPGDFVVGNPAKYTLTFNSSQNIKDYLPGGGGPKVLTKDYVNPKKKDKLGNMADQITAARLNRDFNAAGVLGVNPDFTLGELVFIDGPFANISVNDFLVMAELALGGGDMNGHSASEYSSTAENIILSFHEGHNAGILTCPNQESNPNIVVSSTCSDPDVIFTISNTGDDMNEAKDYTLFKNNVAIGNGTYQLDLNQSLEITSTGTINDEFKLVIETPAGETVEEIINGCAEEEEENNTTDEFGGTLAYEDLWPGKGDYDFNDLVVDYDFEITKDNQEVVKSITAEFVVKAFGASLHNGFGFTLPTVSPSDIVSVSGYDVVNNTTFNIAGNGVENGQSKATFIVFDDVRRIMPQTTGGIGVNTQLAYDYIDPVKIVLEIVFADNAITFSELNIGDFNPFLIVNTINNGIPLERGLEIHLPNYEPSDLFDITYFGQADDDSSVASGRYFVTDNNLPWAINIAEEFDWVIEFQDITGAYLNFAEWAESGGSNFDDWYKDFSGYRNNSLIYPTQIGK